MTKALGFAAAVANWAKKTEEKQTDILHLAIRMLDDEIASRAYREQD